MSDTGRSPYEAELAAQRDIIDATDAEIVVLINRRTAAALQIGRIKADNGLPIYVGSREGEVLDKVSAANQGGIVPDEEMRGLFSGIMKASRAAQQRLHDEGRPAPGQQLIPESM